MTTTYKLGNVALAYTRFSWPKYRGTVARFVEIDQPAELFSRLYALARGLNGKPTTLTVTGPAKAGATDTSNNVEIAGVYIERVFLTSEALCRVVLADRRLLLSRFVSPRDFNIRFGDKDEQGRIKYLNGTEFPRFQNAVLNLLESKSDTGIAFREFVNPESYTAPDGLHLAGLPYALALADLLDRYSMSLTVWNDGDLRVVDMADTKTNLPTGSGYSWEIEPGWELLTGYVNYVGGRPNSIRVYYPERHCLRMTARIVGSGDRQTSAPPATQPDEELRVELEQVYKAADAEGNPRYLTLSELLEAHDLSGAITDSEICTAYMSETFQGTGLYSEYDTENTRKVIRSIKECWRKLWRIKYTGRLGAIGGWTDWAFGKINADGSVRPVTVECDWVEFLNEPAPVEGGGGQQTFIGAAVTENHESPAPFSADWEGGDSSLGIIRLTQNVIRDQNFAVPGALVTPLTVKKVAQVSDGDGNPHTVQDGDFDYVEVERYDRARFHDDFEIAIYACATKRMPNNEKRWHLENVDGFGDGDIEFVELPPGSELYCIRDYVSAESGHTPQADGLGPVLNADQLSQDAQARGEVWKATHTNQLQGFGVAQSVAAFKDTEVRGGIAEVILEVDGEQVQTRVIAGNLADYEARVRRAAKRLADRSFKTAGAK